MLRSGILGGLPIKDVVPSAGRADADAAVVGAALRHSHLGAWARSASPVSAGGGQRPAVDARRNRPWPASRRRGAVRAPAPGWAGTGAGVDPPDPRCRWKVGCRVDPCLLDDATAALGPAACIDDVLLPAMRQIGVWLTVGHCDVMQERMATEAVRTWLDRRSAFTPAPNRPRPILLACGPSDLHTIRVESTAVLLRYQGWPCRVLGAQDLDRHACGGGAGLCGCRCRRGVPSGVRAPARRRVDPGRRRFGHRGLLRRERVLRAADPAGGPGSRPRRRHQGCLRAAHPSLGTHRPRTSGSPRDLSEVVDCQVLSRGGRLSAPAEAMQVAPETI